jgi:formylglycine-generating enzyme required for sulfatase activity
MVDLTPVASASLRTPVALGRTEVTMAEWSACFRAGYCRRWKPETGGADRPATHVTWGDALDFVDYLNARSRNAGRCARYRLPRPAEWAAAAAGGASTRYPWGETPSAGRAACRGCGSPYDGRSAAAVASFPTNGFGLHDMAGNVWEWLADDACSHEAYIGGRCTPGQVAGGGYSTALAAIDLATPAFSPRSGPRGGLQEPGWPSVGLRVACDLDRAATTGSD